MWVQVDNGELATTPSFLSTFPRYDSRSSAVNASFISLFSLIGFLS